MTTETDDKPEDKTNGQEAPAAEVLPEAPAAEVLEAEVVAPGEVRKSPSVAPVGELRLDPQAEISRLRDQLLRTAADFDNFRKRARRE